MERDEGLIAAFASELIVRRKQRKLSQEALAYKAGVNRTYIAKLELAKNQPTLSVLYQIATALDCELSELLAVAIENYRHLQKREKRNSALSQKLTQSDRDETPLRETGKEDADGNKRK